MTHAHLVLVHLPVVALPLVAGGHLLAWLRNDPFWTRLFEFAWLLVALSAVAAYVTGGSAFEELRLGLWTGDAGELARAIAEQHALIGRAAFLELILAGAFVLQIILQRLQGQEPARWQGWLLFALGLLGSGLLLWTAALGGPITHLDLR